MQVRRRSFGENAGQGKNPTGIEVEALILGALCPGDDGLCRWLGIDLDAADDHGPAGLVDPKRAMRCVAERAEAAGLGSGLLAARSKRGLRRHVWIIPPFPMPLGDAVLALQFAN